jgi:hypothetical protein
MMMGASVPSRAWVFLHPFWERVEIQILGTHEFSSYALLFFLFYLGIGGGRETLNFCVPCF